MRKGSIATLAAAACLATIVPGRAATIWQGECRVLVTVSTGLFKVRLNNPPPPKIDIVTKAEDNTCTFTNGTTSGTGTFSVGFTGTGLADTAWQCHRMDGGGGYSASFTGPSPRPPANTGDWSFLGNVHAARLLMRGKAANGADVIFAGTLRATDDSANKARIDSCMTESPNEGATKFTFFGNLAINDPKLDD